MSVYQGIRPPVPVEKEAQVRHWMRANPEQVPAFLAIAMALVDRQRDLRYVLLEELRTIHAHMEPGHAPGEQRISCVGCEMFEVARPDEAQR